MRFPVFSVKRLCFLALVMLLSGCASGPRLTLESYENSLQARADQLAGRYYQNMRFKLYKNQLMNSGRRIMVAPVLYDAEFEGKTVDAVGYGGGYQEPPLWWAEDHVSGDLRQMPDRLLTTLLAKLDRNTRFKGVNPGDVSHFVSFEKHSSKHPDALFPLVAGDTTSHYRSYSGADSGQLYLPPSKLQKVAKDAREYADSVLFVAVHALWRKVSEEQKSQGVYARQTVIDDETVIQYSVSFQIQMKLCSPTECSSAALPTTALRQITTDIPLPLEDFDEQATAKKISDYAARFHAQSIASLVDKTMNYLAFGRIK